MGSHKPAGYITVSPYRRVDGAAATIADNRGGVKDTGGTTWWIATKVE
jgi:hypothetical protein